MSNDYELKPCPFCGETEKLEVMVHDVDFFNEHYALVRCHNCDTQGGYYKLELETLRQMIIEHCTEKATAAWNRRENDA